MNRQEGTRKTRKKRHIRLQMCVLCLGPLGLSFLSFFGGPIFTDFLFHALVSFSGCTAMSVGTPKPRLYSFSFLRWKPCFQNTLSDEIWMPRAYIMFYMNTHSSMCIWNFIIYNIEFIQIHHLLMPTTAQSQNYQSCSKVSPRAPQFLGIWAPPWPLWDPAWINKKMKRN